MNTFLKQEQGYSLIEILVSVLVLAIGFLGMAGLQTSSLQNAQRSVLRTQATYLSHEILEKMRANRSQSYDTTTPIPFATSSCLTQSCTAEEIRNFDISQWQCALGNNNEACADNGVLANSLYANDLSLPSGSGDITYSVIGGATLVTITVRWDEGRNEEDAHSFELTTYL